MYHKGIGDKQQKHKELTDCIKWYKAVILESKV